MICNKVRMFVLTTKSPTLRVSNFALCHAVMIVQLNCQRSCGDMNDLSSVLMNEKVNVAMLQELYVLKERLCGLPCSWRAYFCGRVPTKTRVVIWDEIVEASFCECVYKTVCCLRG